MSNDAIIFSNVIVDTIKCYAIKHNEDENEIFKAISMSFNKEDPNEHPDSGYAE